MFGILGVTIRLLLRGFEDRRFAARTPRPRDRRHLIGVTEAAVARKGHACDRILADARRLVRTGQLGQPLDQSLLRACELLDDIDDMLVVLHPSLNDEEFATAAALHRDLERIQELIAARHRVRMSMPAPAGERQDSRSPALWRM